MMLSFGLLQIGHSACIDGVEVARCEVARIRICTSNPEPLFTYEGRRKCETDRHCGKKEAKPKGKALNLAVNLNSFLTKRTRCWTQVAEIICLCRVVGHSLRDRVRSSSSQEELRIEPCSSPLRGAS